MLLPAPRMSAAKAALLKVSVGVRVRGLAVGVRVKSRVMVWVVIEQYLVVKV